MDLLFVHGWGFSPAVWQPLRIALTGHSTQCLDLGYFADATAGLPDRPFVAIGHSFGVMWWLAHMPHPACRALISINGFARFTATPDGAPGVAPRVVDRMIARFATAPDTVLNDFLARCGSQSPAPAPCRVAPLARDLARLRHEDFTSALPALALPLLALDGETDPILPPALRATTFAGAPHVVRQTRAGHGHMLPESDPAWCAATIRTFLQDIRA